MVIGARAAGPTAPRRPDRRQGGFTYLAVLILVAMIGAGLGATGQVWRTVTQREKEAQLLWIGNEFRQAIGRFVEQGTGAYPRELSDLLLDKHSPGIKRYLRKIYRDPITNSVDWGLVRAPDGGIAGVFSPSQEKPLKVAGFAKRDARFENSKKYSDWIFAYEGQTTLPPVPRGTPEAGTPGAGGGPVPPSPFSLPASPQGTGGEPSSPSPSPSQPGAGGQPPSSPSPFMPGGAGR